MPSEDHYVERYHAHRKWMNRHLLLASLSVLTLVGVLWAWIPAIRWWQHRSKAKQAKSHVDGEIV